MSRPLLPEPERTERRKAATARYRDKIYGKPCKWCGVRTKEVGGYCPKCVRIKEKK